VEVEEALTWVVLEVEVQVELVVLDFIINLLFNRFHNRLQLGLVVIKDQLEALDQLVELEVRLFLQT
jgi:hypothetical protein